MGIDTLTKLQSELGEKIQALFTNAKKDSSSRKTVEYCIKKKGILEVYWAEFQDRHDTIVAAKIPSENLYISKDYFNQVKMLVFDITKYIDNIKTQLECAAAPASQSATRSDGGTRSTLGQSTPTLKAEALMIRKQIIQIGTVKDIIDECVELLKTKQTAIHFEYWVNYIQTQWNAILSRHQDILLTDNEDTARYTQGGQYEETRAQVAHIIQLLHDEIVAIGPNSSKDKIRLAHTNIPHFDGQYQNWQEFHDMFLRFVHENRKFSPVEKIQYLKTSLKGPAAKLIAHLQVSDDHYEAAWRLVTTRFANNRILVSTHVNNLFQLPKMTTEASEEIKQIHDTINESLHAINNLGFDTNSWSPVISHILHEKLDRETVRLYEQTVAAPKKVPEMKDILEFLETRFQSLEATYGYYKRNNKKETQKREPWAAKSYHTHPQRCGFCKKEHHAIYQCKQFIELSSFERYNFIAKQKICINCLTHPKEDVCRSEKRCIKCTKRHHTLLHHENRENTPRAATNVSSVIENPVRVLLATALIKVQTYESSWEYMRALIDPGSQTSFITEEAATTLGLPRSKASIQIAGVGNTGAGTSNGKINTVIKPRFPSKFELKSELLVLKELTAMLPGESSPAIHMKCLQNHMIADPTYNIPGPINILIGADVYPLIVKEGLEKPKQGYLAQNTELGWTISGKLGTSDLSMGPTLSMMLRAEDQCQLSKFWEMEEVQLPRAPTRKDEECEQIYSVTTSRDEKGKYTVRLPFKEEVGSFEETRNRAMARLLQMERRFQTNKSLKDEYLKFMKEYEQLGHMSVVQPSGDERDAKYYIPHHAVRKEDSTTTKLRVVFDASAKGSAGKCLNEMMFIGPKLQDDLYQILLRWRKHKIVISADVEKMYRQIMIHKADQRFQTILWRYDAKTPVQEYQLHTVTYGTSSAPYLAVRTLQQLADDEKQTYPVAAKTAMNDFYVDDLITGCDTIDDAIKLQDELIKLLQRGGFNLRKWKSNCSQLLNNLPVDMQDKQISEMDEYESSKLLGVHWAPVADMFRYDVKISNDENPTKRKILSEVARLYDPLGWLAPITIIAKLMVQELWLNANKWDDPVPLSVHAKWTKFKAELPKVKDIMIPRWIKHSINNQVIELHGFCDASELAYGAAVYSQVIDESGQITTTLLTAKFKVAPIKMKKTLPRLELCGATLLAKLLRATKDGLQIPTVKTYAWTDSMITLAWIKGGPAKWKNFVANRVSEIIEVTNQDEWHHVKSDDNPADLVSRGVLPSQLTGNTLWWSGPAWLQQSQLPQTLRADVSTHEEKKKQKVNVMTASVSNDWLIVIEKYSSLSKLIRIVAYCIRFIQKCKKVHTVGHLTTSELQSARIHVFKWMQMQYFTTEINAIRNEKTINSKSQLVTLNPFLDEKGLLRVGGRLKHSSLTFDEKHPIIVSNECQIARSIINEAHIQTLHGGNQLTLTIVRRKYWIMRGKNLVRQTLHKCITCVRHKSNNEAKQMMGNLPERRVTMSHPFTHTGVDFAGPIQIRMSKGRGNKSYKGYISIFVCMATKAVHLEAVSDMTTDAFLAAFRRFTARRGHCSHMYSDNGTNFVGAKRVLDAELAAAMKQVGFLQPLATDGTVWHFSPPAAPHFGGLWEAGVKSTKHHLKRVVGEQMLTFEELSTVLGQIEACLNSRPLCAVTEDPDDFVLTPGHFLIGRPLLAQADTIDLSEDETPVSRWKLLQKMKRDFWRTWSSEYLHRLQQRFKWQTPKANIQPGDVVLIKEENVTPSKWPLGRIVKAFPGKDDKTRVVVIKTKNGTEIKRPIVKVCPLPINEDMPKSATVPSKVATIMLTLLTIACIIPYNRATSYTIKTPAPGLYIEHLGEALINRGKLRIDIPINTTTLQQHKDVVNQSIARYQEVCNISVTLGGDRSCESQAAELQTRFEELQLQIRFIRSGNMTRTTRPNANDGIWSK